MKFTLIAVLLFSLPFNIKSCLRKDTAVVAEPSGVEKDSATILKELQEARDLVESNKIVSYGTIGGYEFNGKSRKVTNIDMMMENGMEMLMNEGKYAEIKLHDDVHGITLAVRIIDLQLLDRVPFSYTFTEGRKLIVTVFVKNKQGVNEMYGGTIRNIRGRFTVTGIDKANQKITGMVDGDFTNVLDLTSSCRVDQVHFTNAGYFFSKHTRVNDTSLFRNKDAIIVQ